MSTEPSDDAVHWKFLEHEGAPAINLCAATQLQLEREGNVVLVPTANSLHGVNTCEHCRLVARDQDVP